MTQYKSIRFERVIYILYFVLIANLCASADYKVAGEEGSAFIIEALDKWTPEIRCSIRSMVTAKGLQFVEVEPSEHPDQGATIRFKSETGEETFNCTTISPIKAFKPLDGKVYTLEEEFSPQYSMLIARKLADDAKNIYRTSTEYIDWTRPYIRCYGPEMPQGKTLIELPKIHGFPEFGSAPIGFFPTSSAILLLYIRGNRVNNDFLCNMLVVKHSLKISDSPTTTTFREISIYAPPRGIQLYNNRLYLIRTLGEYDLNLGNALFDIVKADLDTGDISTLLRAENIAFYAVDDAAGQLIYASVLVHTEEEGPNEYFLNRLPLNNLNAQPMKEKLPFSIFYQFNWDANLKRFQFLLPPNEPLNGTFSKGGWYAVELSCNPI